MYLIFIRKRIKLIWIWTSMQKSYGCNLTCPERKILKILGNALNVNYLINMSFKLFIGEKGLRAVCAHEALR